MIPETLQYISQLAEQAHALGIEVLVEVHGYHRDQVDIARRVDRVYDFALPPLVLHTIFQKNGRALKEWLSFSPRNAVTVLDTHDGIGVIDVGLDPRDLANRPGLLPAKDIDRLVETIHEGSAGQSRKATGAEASNLDLYQVNCTYYDALGRRDGEYLLARAIQFFAPGIPQIYYTGLFAGENDMQLLARTGVGRDINRHYYTTGEIQAAMERPVVRVVGADPLPQQTPSVRRRIPVPECSESEVVMEWRAGAEFARLEVDLLEPAASIAYSTKHGTARRPLAPAAADVAVS